MGIFDLLQNLLACVFYLQSLSAMSLQTHLQLVRQGRIRDMQARDFSGGIFRAAY